MAAREPSCALLADRNHTVQEGVRGLLESRFEAVVVVADVPSLLECALRMQPDLVAVDVSLAQDAGLHWIEELRRRCPHCGLIALSVHDEASVRAWAMRAGCDGFVLKRAIAAELLTTIERVLHRS